jgi:polysaccharide export outer membrane protein
LISGVIRILERQQVMQMICKHMMGRLLAGAVLLVAALAGAQADEKIVSDTLGPGDVIRVLVYKNPDLSAEYRIQESGQISFPLIGAQQLAGRTLPEAEKQIRSALVSGGFIQAPQVSINLVSARRQQAVVLGNVAKPGLVPLDFVNTRLSDVLALAGGITPAGSDNVIVTGQRNGANFRREINISQAYGKGENDGDVPISGGDVVYVPRAQVFYAYGEVQKPGAYRLENQMTLQQALVTAGGLSKRGTENRVRVQRRKPDGSYEEIAPVLTDVLLPDDVIFVRESLF